MDRRSFLGGLGSSALFAPGITPVEATACTAGLSLSEDQPGRPIAVDFVGLSYESAVVSAGEYFTPANRSVLGLIGGLGREGVLRIGGNTSERTVWRTDGQAAPPERFVITPAAIDRLAQAVRSLGWGVIYGLNLARGTPEEAADEAAYVAQALGSQLIAMQISNEPDGFGSWSGVRPSSYSFNQFLAEWRSFHAAIRARVPHLAFAGPDVAAATNWVSAFANTAPEGLVLLTRHYYADGPATAEHVTLPKLLASAPQVLPILAELENDSRAYHLPYRIAETNSVFAGGRPGVSDTFGAALWGLELMFQIAAAGGVGINFHAGDDKVYTPIARLGANAYQARPLYYAMLMFAKTCRGTLVPTRLTSSNRDLSAFAARHQDGLGITAINKSEVNRACIEVSYATPWRAATILRLTAPTLHSTDAVTLGGALVDSFGRWAANNEEPARIEGDHIFLDVAPASAAALLLSTR
jgi:hypothetical protein